MTGTVPDGPGECPPAAEQDGFDAVILAGGPPAAGGGSVGALAAGLNLARVRGNQ